VNKVIATDVISLFHVYSMIAWAISKKNIGLVEINLLPNRNGNICIKLGEINYGQTKIVLKEQLNSRKEKNTLGSVFKIFQNIIAFVVGRFFETKKVIFVAHHSYFKPTMLSYLTFKQCFYARVVCFEEGVGTYGDLRHWVDSSRREGKKNPHISFYVKKYLSYFCTEKYKVLFNPTESQKKSFKEAVEIISAYRGRQVIDSLDLVGDDSIVYFSSPLIDLLDVGEKAYRNFLLKLKKILPKVDIYVKPHPLESKSLSVYREEGFKLLPSDIDAEEVIRYLKPSLVVGGFSGVLLIARNVYDIKVVNIADKMGEEFSCGVEYSSAIRTLFTDL